MPFLVAPSMQWEARRRRPRGGKSLMEKSTEWKSRKATCPKQSQFFRDTLNPFKVRGTFHCNVYITTLHHLSTMDVDNVQILQYTFNIIVAILLFHLALCLPFPGLQTVGKGTLQTIHLLSTPSCLCSSKSWCSFDQHSAKSQGYKTYREPARLWSHLPRRNWQNSEFV